MYLDKKQYKFLRQMLNSDDVMYESLSDEEISILRYLEDIKFVDVKRESNYGWDAKDQKLKRQYGRPISAKVSEPGKAYISERKHSLKIFLLKDAVVPIIVSIITNLIIIGIQLLLSRGQQ